MVNRFRLANMRFVLALLWIILFFFTSNAQAGWKNLWFTPDQQGMHALSKGDPKLAAQLFKNQLWQGVAYYRSGQYKEAIEDFAKSDTPLANFNRGNALAQLGYYQDAVAAYNRALSQDQNFIDAKFNRDLLKKLLQQQNKNQSEQQQSKNNQNNNNQSKASSASEPKETKTNNPPNNTPNKNTPDQAKQNKSRPNQTDAKTNNSQNNKTEKNNNRTSESGNNDQTNPATPESAENDLPSTKNLTQTQPTPNQQRKLPAAMNQFNEGKPSKVKQNPKLDSSVQQWIQQIPDDPGGLLKQKFLRDHLRIQMQQDGTL